MSVQQGRPAHQKGRAWRPRSGGPLPGGQTPEGKGKTDNLALDPPSGQEEGPERRWCQRGGWRAGTAAPERRREEGVREQQAAVVPGAGEGGRSPESRPHRGRE